MSARNAALILNPEARRDLQSIALFSDEQWGRRRSDAYLDAINRAFTTLSDNPRVGRIRDDLGSDLRSFRVQQHIMYYRLEEDTIFILRILHGKVDASRHFSLTED